MAGIRKPRHKQRAKSSKPMRGRLTLPSAMAAFAAWLAKHDDHTVGSLEVSDEAPGEGH